MKKKSLMLSKYEFEEEYKNRYEKRSIEKYGFVISDEGLDKLEKLIQEFKAKLCQRNIILLTATSG